MATHQRETGTLWGLGMEPGCARGDSSQEGQPKAQAGTTQSTGSEPTEGLPGVTSLGAMARPQQSNLLPERSFC